MYLVVSIIGARPQFVKAAPLSSALRANKGVRELLLHTGQHYDDAMSAIFFRQLGLPQADVNLNAGSGTHGAQTAAMLAGIEEVLLAERPDMVVIYGDTNSTIAGALAAAKLEIPVGHVEAGLRSFNRSMPEEINRIVADRLSDLLFCPSAVARDNLAAEGITSGVHVVGDLMYDAVLHALEVPGIALPVELEPGGYLLATIHRANNTDDPARLAAIVKALNNLGETVIFPVHPRTRKALAGAGLQFGLNVRQIDPVGYFEMVALERNARMILTDSGGVQKEAFWLGVPCVTLRDETEWVETVELGWNTLVGADYDSIVAAVQGFRPTGPRPPVFGDGRAAQHISRLILEALESAPPRSR